MLKRSTCFLGLFALLVSISAGCGNAHAAEPKIWRFNIPMSLESVLGHYAKLFGDKVAELSGGKYKVEIYPNEQLAGGGGGNEAVQMAQQGLTDFDLHNTTMWQVFEPKLDAIASPFLMRSPEAVEQAKQRGLMEYLTRLYRDSCGMQVLGFGEVGWCNWAHRTKFIKTPEDIVGVKMRSPNNSYSAVFRALKANPSYATSNEVVTSLQQGVLDAAPYHMMFMHAQRVTEVAPYYTDCHYSFDLLAMTTSTKLFDSLSPEDQKMVRDAGAYATAEFNRYMVEQLVFMKKDIVENQSGKMYDMTPEAEQAFFESLKDYYREKVKALDCDDLFEICGLDLAWAKGN